MKDRLQEFLDHEQLNSSKLAEILAVQRSGLSHILSGRNKPSFDFIAKMIEKFPTLNAEWLISGKGEIYKDEEGDKRDYSSEAKANNTYEKTLFDVDNKEDRKEKGSFQSPQSVIFNNESVVDAKNRVLKRVIILYDDGTFDHYSPNA